MAPLPRRVLFAAFFVLLTFYTFSHFANINADLLHYSGARPKQRPLEAAPVEDDESDFTWSDRPVTYPVENPVQLPSGSPAHVPTIQYAFHPETKEESDRREPRLAAIKSAFQHTWKGYRSYAWGADEVTPVSGQANKKFGDWGATLVDSLDTLWIMNLEEEFREAVQAVEKIDFTQYELTELNLFETTIRYLGGLLGAYDLSKSRVLLDKAKELGDMLYAAFDTKNRMPITRWNWFSAKYGENDAPGHSALLAEIASLSLEFTRLSQLSGDDKYYDAVARIASIMYKQQNHTHLPGLWPVMVSPRDGVFDSDSLFTLGGMADSAYEYLPKEWLLLQGRVEDYKVMYTTALEAIKQYLVFQPTAPPESYQSILASQAPPLFLGTVRGSGGNRFLIPEGQHLTCFAGGMVALASRIFNMKKDLEFAERLVAGCIWAYQSSPTGIGPEKWIGQSCKQGMDAVTNGEESDWKGEIGDCEWDKNAWMVEVDHRLGDKGAKSLNPHYIEEYLSQHYIPLGMTQVTDPRYLLRPEAIESVFILYRITGDESLRDHAWRMWSAIEPLARTQVAYASLTDVMNEETSKLDSMESFWPAETLKYFYLLFSDPQLVSLDEFVFNTEAHPLRWRRDHGKDV